MGRDPLGWQQKSTAKERPPPGLHPYEAPAEAGDEGDTLFPPSGDDADDFSTLEPPVLVAQVQNPNEFPESEMRGTDYHTMRTANEENQPASTQPDKQVNINLLNVL